MILGTISNGISRSTSSSWPVDVEGYPDAAKQCFGFRGLSFEAPQFFAGEPRVIGGVGLPYSAALAEHLVKESHVVVLVSGWQERVAEPCLQVFNAMRRQVQISPQTVSAVLTTRSSFRR